MSQPAAARLAFRIDGQAGGKNYPERAGAVSG